MSNKIIPYNPRLKAFARMLRKQGILSEVLLWKQIKLKTPDKFGRGFLLLFEIIYRIYILIYNPDPSSWKDQSSFAVSNFKRIRKIKEMP